MSSRFSYPCVDRCGNSQSRARVAVAETCAEVAYADSAFVENHAGDCRANNNEIPPRRRQRGFTGAPGR